MGFKPKLSILFLATVSLAVAGEEDARYFGDMLFPRGQTLYASPASVLLQASCLVAQEETLAKYGYLDPRGESGAYYHFLCGAIAFKELHDPAAPVESGEWAATFFLDSYNPDSAVWRAKIENVKRGFDAAALLLKKNIWSLQNAKTEADRQLSKKKLVISEKESL